MTGWEAPTWADRLAGIAWRAIVVVVALAMVIGIFVGLGSVILPVILGLLFACGLRPVATWLSRAGVPNALAAAIAVVGLIVAIGAVAWLTVNAVVDQWDEIAVLMEAGQATLTDAATDGGVESTTAGTISDDLRSVVGTFVGWMLGGLVQFIPTVAGFVASLVLSFVVTFFFLKDGRAMWRWILRRAGGVSDLMDTIGAWVWTTITGYIIGQTVIAAVDATLITLGALIIGVPEPAAIFMLTFFGAYVPYIGAFLSGLVGVLLALGDSGLDAGVAMLAVVLAVQVFEGNVLQPWIQGRAVRLHPLVIALSVTAGGALAGFLGVFLAVPIVAAGFVALSELRKAGIVGPVPTLADPTPP